VADKVRALWRTLWGKLLILGVLGFFLFTGAAFAAAKSTESNRFCGVQCHEMLPYNQTWQASKHSNVDCVKCHIPPGAWNFIKTKFFALREVYVHFIGLGNKPIQVTRQIPNVICVGCHPASQIAKTVQLSSATFSHSGHSKVPACIDCHSQLVHEPIPGVTYIPPQSMTGCFKCHDGKQQPNNCDYCHTAPHPDRGACQDCHNMQSWVPGAFNHPVPLTGPHAQILCEQCHTQSTSGSMGPADGCVNCHGNHHNDPQLTLCATCHTTTGFTPSTFVHPQEGEHIPKGEQPLPCTACHTQTFSTATCSCHGGKPPTGGG
jgi:nitrate/TMAO reductase-like tetraheme cytochrome c subunit